MNLVELHILQSFPVTCLNRDDLGSPKSALFGGVERARVSSQCWKRAVRTLAHEYSPELFAGVRTKLVGPQVEAAAKRLGCSDAQCRAYAALVVELLGKDKGAGEVKTLLFFSPDTMDNVMRNLLESNVISEDMISAMLSEDKKKAEKAVKDAVKVAGKLLKVLGARVSDAADIALFGRMVADDASQTVEGAAMFSHALSTHAVRSDLDFFSAVDDEKISADDAGAGHIGTVEFNSACYYRYVGVNIDLLRQSMLFDTAQLGSVMHNFIRATVLANPVARRNSMFGNSLPAYILGVKRSGQPLSLANAFEEPVFAGNNGYVATSVAKMLAEWEGLKKTFAICTDAEVSVAKEGETLDTLISALTTGI